MTFPSYYDPARIGQLYNPNVALAADLGLKSGLKPAYTDSYRVFLLLVDVQADFVHPDGALAVPGAVEDTRRVVEWIYKHTGEITQIGATLDSHLPIQIFSPTWWANDNGDHPAPYTEITSADVRGGVWKPLYDVAWSIDYVEVLEEQAKKRLMIWPYHTLIGTPGHAIVPSLLEAIAYHTAARQSQPHMYTKGMIPKTENYSVIEPEVKVPDHPNGRVNTALMDEIGSYDLIYIAGQAKSHCVLETVTSMMRYYPPEIVKKMRILEDAMSSVAHPVIDFEAMSQQAFGVFAQYGLTLTTTNEPIG
jgi:nicotinamidase-related amidase